MKVLCRKNNAKGIDLNEVKTIFSNDYDYSFGGYGLEIGVEYLVTGIVLYKEANCLYYLIDIKNRPHVFPYLLFTISDNALPTTWSIRVNYKNDDRNIYCVWGFEELCNDETFYDQLLNREDYAMRTYFKRKMEIEEPLE